MRANKLHIMTKTITIVAILLLSVVACKQKKETATVDPNAEAIALAEAKAAIAKAEEAALQADRDTLLFYQRGACFGMCPIFDLVVYESGRAVYLGKNYVDRIGVYQTTIDPTALQKIRTTADAIGYFGLQESYDNPHVTDLPTTVTMIASGEGKLKTVANRYKGPAGLRTLYEELDKMVEAQDWKLIQSKN